MKHKEKKHEKHEKEHHEKHHEKHEKHKDKHHKEKKHHHSKAAMKHADKPGEGAKKRKHLGGKAKVATVIEEFKHGTLRSGGSGKHVTNPKQAIAIGLSEARKSGAKIPKKSKESHKTHWSTH